MNEFHRNLLADSIKNFLTKIRRFFLILLITVKDFNSWGSYA
jgi:hypothetical protein